MSLATWVVGPLEGAVFFTVSLSAFQKSIQKSRTETRIEGREMEEGRRVGVAVDFSDSSRNALRWAVDNFVRKGDYLILVTVLGRAFYEGGEMQLWEATGSQRKGSDDGLPSLNPSPSISRFKLEISNLESQALNHTLRALIPLTDFSNPNIMKKYGVKPDPETLDIVNTAAAQKEIAVVLKIYWGDAREKLCEAIDNTPLSCIFIGNRGLGKLKRVIMGSVSNHVVNNGSCPVTVVKS